MIENGAFVGRKGGGSFLKRSTQDADAAGDRTRSPALVLMRCWSCAAAASSSRTASARPRFTSRTASSSASSSTRAKIRPALESSTPATWSSRLASSTRTCTSTSRAGPNGKGFDTATRAAAAGGVTTIVDMPLNSIPATTTVAALRGEAATAARAQCHVDVGFWGGVVPGNAGELDALVDAGVRGFKCFLVPSGVDEFPAVDEDDLRAGAADPRASQRAAAGARRIAGADRLAGRLAAPGEHIGARRFQPTRLRDLSGDTAAGGRGRGDSPDGSARARSSSARVHIVHVSSAEGVADDRARPRRRRSPITAETCPHYLTFAAEEIADGATEFKCAPPIRDAAHRDALWQRAGAAARSIWSRPTIRRRRRS